METAKANGLNLETYIHHLLTLLTERFAVNSDPQIDDLLPWSESIRESFAASSRDY